MVFAMTVLGLNAQNRAVSGTVVDAQGVPVIGASVVLVGNTSVGAMTDIDGKFALNVPANANLSVSCIGYATQVIAVATRPPSMSFFLKTPSSSRRLSSSVTVYRRRVTSPVQSHLYVRPTSRTVPPLMRLQPFRERYQVCTS